VKKELRDLGVELERASTIRGRVTRPIVAGGTVDASLPVPACNASLDG